ncbi:MAG: dihydrofolate reductase family protein [Thermoprotei archaeon]|nr:dihydrofolate reductase family protein [Thermoprotei archaeon]
MRPYTIIFSTETVDGRIASRTGYSRLSCLEDLRLLHSLRAWSDAVMVGANTVLVDNPSLTVRLVEGRSSYRVVVDPSLRVPPSSRVFDSPGRGVLVTLSKWSSEDLRGYIERGAVIVRAGFERLDLCEAVAKLYEMGVRRLLVEGGGVLNCTMLAEGLVDELRVTVAPYVFGSGVSLASCEAFDGGNSRVELALTGYMEVCPGWVHLAYRVLRPRRLL